MKSRLWSLLVLLCCGVAAAQQFVPALPGYQYHFPQDHFNHPEFQTEWWYYTGNLRAKDGHRFGFELTFFRQGISRKPDPSPWAVHDLYMAHLALSDISGSRYYKSERINRAGPGIAGIDSATGTVWNGNWQTHIGEKSHTLRGIGENFALELTAIPEKPPVIHGENGVSRKAEGLNHASHYISFTRMNSSGTIELHGTRYSVEGDAWMDHEFFSESADGDEVGWDWLSLQLADNTELMLYRLRHRDGTVDPYSSGTYIDAAGKSTHLSLSDFQMNATGETWKSKETGAAYPVAWTVAIPALHLQLSITTPLDAQEFVSRVGPSYWEGAIDIAGQRDNNAVHGTGYLEMTGYSEAKQQGSGRSPFGMPADTH
jgi:predicted secreted hydrolase